ncbi:MAG TPA: FAD-binding protein [Polyangiaceae bacterium]|jgi:hypothetical protein|nr:FAD-binding protein [Polyangiaceae bacterium]
MASVPFRPNVTWQNMHQTVPAVTSARLYTPRNLRADGTRDPANSWRPGLDALLQIVADSETLKRRVRALGGLWSLSPVAILQDHVIDTTNLTESVMNLPDGAVDPAANQGRPFVFAQAGSRVVDFHEQLMAAGFDLPTCGASNGQTLGGAIATGTHGSAIDVGAMQDYVVGIHLIGAAGRHVWLERASRPIVTNAFVAMLGAELVRDDAMFNATLVSFGSFGIVHAYMLEVEHTFMLEEYVKKIDFSAAMQLIAGGVIDTAPLALPPGNERPFHFELVVDPYHRADGANGVCARVMYKRKFAPQPPDPGGVSSTPSAGILGTIAGLLDKFPGPIDRAALEAAVPFFLSLEVPTVSGRIATPAAIFGDTSLRTGGISMELGFELADVPRAADILCDAADQNLYAGILAFRFVKSSTATLAFTRSPNVTRAAEKARIVCTVETDALSTDGTTNAMNAFWANLDSANVPYTLHWGQKLRQDPSFLKKAYGPSLATWLAQRTKWLPTPDARHLFSSDLLDTMGLST